MRTAEVGRGIVALKPDICSLDLCTMWSRVRAFMNVPDILIEMADGSAPRACCLSSNVSTAATS